VKRMFFALAGMSALTLAIFAGRLLYAQNAQSASSTPAAAPKTHTRVALLNLTYVVKNYKKFQTYQEELKKLVEPYQAKDTSWKAEGEKLAKDAQAAGVTQEKREEIERKLRELQRNIEDNKQEVQKVLVKEQEKQLKTLYLDVYNVVSRYAQAHNYEMVLHYNDAVTQEDYWSAANIARKMQTGALMPMYMTGGLDISANVVQTLNANFSGK
jgi:outer membrane protein